MRIRTAAVLSFVIVGGMLAMPRAAGHLARWYVARGIETIPSYQRLFFGLAMFVGSWWWALAPMTVGVLFTIALVSSQMHSGR